MGVTLPVDRWGSGTPTLFLHGFTGSRRSWDPVRPFVEKQLSAIVVDLPGHGDAPMPRPGREGFLDTLDAIAETLNREGQDRVDVVGYSQGARVALGFALRHPQRVARLILESGSPGLRRRKARTLRRAQDEALAERIVSEGVDAFVQRWEALPLFDGLRRLPAPTQEQLRARRQGNTAEALAAALRGLGVASQPDFWPELHSVRAPTLLLSGSEDVKFTRIARQMAAELPMVWGRVFEGCGHVPHLEATAEWAAEVTAFLSTPYFDQASFGGVFSET